ncbi:TPA: hypothetical protein JAN03_11735 [Citrobacter freundii]|nr:hypothetical protein [Citrobacter freundii]
MKNSIHKTLFGYCIYINDIRIHVDLTNSTIMNSANAETVKLRDTMMRLFVFLIENADGKYISNKDILYHVWDRHGLKSSNQRLWQVMQFLINRLCMAGIPAGFIEHKDHIGYTVNSSEIMKLYYERQQ